MIPSLNCRQSEAAYQVVNFGSLELTLADRLHNVCEVILEFHGPFSIPVFLLGRGPFSFFMAQRLEEGMHKVQVILKMQHVVCLEEGRAISSSVFLQSQIYEYMSKRELRARNGGHSLIVPR